jgi:hypothetical protein
MSMRKTFVSKLPAPAWRRERNLQDSNSKYGMSNMGNKSKGFTSFEPERLYIKTCIIHVPFASLVASDGSLYCLHSVLNNEKVSLLLQPTRPALQDCCACGLVIDTMGFNAVVRVLSHKHLGLSKLHVRNGKSHCDGLVLHSANLFGQGETVFLWVERSVGQCSLVLCTFLKNAGHQIDTQLLRFMAFHTPREPLVRNGWQKHSVPLVKGSMHHADWITSTRHTDSLQDTTVSELLSRALSCHHEWLGGIVRLDTPNIVRIGLLHALNQTSELLLELLADSF